MQSNQLIVQFQHRPIPEQLTYYAGNIISSCKKGWDTHSKYENLKQTWIYFKAGKICTHMWLQLQPAFAPLQWALTCFAFCKAALQSHPHEFSSIVWPVAYGTDESLQIISCSRKSEALLVKDIKQQKSQQEPLQTLLQPVRAFQYWQTLQQKRELIPDRFDTSFHQDSHERPLFSFSKPF